MTNKQKSSQYRVEASHRYDYWAIDLFRGKRCEKTVLAGLKKKQADVLEGEINNIINKVFKEV